MREATENYMPGAPRSLGRNRTMSGNRAMMMTTASSQIKYGTTPLKISQCICGSKYVHADGGSQTGDLAHEAQADDENIGAVAHGVEHGEYHGYGDDDDGNDVHDAAAEDVQQHHQHKDEERG